LTASYSRRLDQWKLTLVVTPRAGVNTVDNIIRRLGGKRPRKMPQLGPLPGYLNVKFFRNPFARAVSSFFMRKRGTFIEYLDWLPKNLGRNHHGPQFNSGDAKKFLCIKIEEFHKFVEAFNKFGGHDFVVSDFRAGHVHPKIDIEGPLHDVPLKEILERCNPNLENPIRDATKLSARGKPVTIPTYRAFYTDEVVERVANIFREDINQLGYKFEDMKPISKPEDLYG
jgi:hypothetical protein